eukprot:1852576-Pleurochrysis_carterae.AAC.1
MAHLERRLTAAGGPLAEGPPSGKRAKLRAAHRQAEQLPPARRTLARQRAANKWDARRVPS